MHLSLLIKHSVTYLPYLGLEITKLLNVLLCEHTASA